MSISVINWTRVSLASFWGFIAIMSLVEKLYF
jgi:hypothetical protein